MAVSQGSSGNRRLPTPPHPNRAAAKDQPGAAALPPASNRAPVGPAGAGFGLGGRGKERHGKAVGLAARRRPAKMALPHRGGSHPWAPQASRSPALGTVTCSCLASSEREPGKGAGQGSPELCCSIPCVTGPVATGGRSPAWPGPPASPGTPAESGWQNRRRSLAAQSPCAPLPANQ